MEKLNKFIAFTLAETLIVMGIIGVVAALTLPNLNSSTGDKEKVAKVKKLYSNIEDAFGRVQAVYGPINEWQSLDVNDQTIYERMSDFLKISKEIKTSIAGYGFPLPLMSAFLADGSVLSTEGCDSNVRCIWIDIDGMKGKNKLCDDQFVFHIDVDNNEVKPFRKENLSSSDIVGMRDGVDYCSGWVIDNGNLDYLKVNDSGKCNNSNVTLSVTNTTCK